MKEDKTEKWFCNQPLINCIFGIFLMLFMGSILLFAKEKLPGIKEPQFYAPVIGVLIFFLVASIVGIYYLRKKITFLESNERIVEKFRKVVTEAINFADVGKLLDLLNIYYALSYCVEKNKASAFSELIGMFNKEKIGAGFLLLWFNAAELGHVDIMKKIQELELCDKDVQLPGNVTAAHVALDHLPPQIDVIRYLVNIGADLTVCRTIDQKTPYELVPELYREACKLLPETAPKERPEEAESEAEQVAPEERPEEAEGDEPGAEKAETEQVEQAEQESKDDEVPEPAPEAAEVDLLDDEEDSESKEAGSEENAEQGK